jgi:hypothetical protein
LLKAPIRVQAEIPRSGAGVGIALEDQDVAGLGLAGVLDQLQVPVDGRQVISPARLNGFHLLCFLNARERFSA